MPFGYSPLAGRTASLVLQKQVQHRDYRFADADRKIPGRGQCLGAGDDTSAVFEQHCIGKRSAGVEAEPQARSRIYSTHQ